MARIDELGVIVLTNGPTQDEISRSLWATAENRTEPVSFEMTLGLLQDENGTRVVEPLHESTLKVRATVFQVTTETENTQVLPGCVRLSLRVEREPKGLVMRKDFDRAMVKRIISQGAYLLASYNTRTYTGGVLLGDHKLVVGSQDYWETRTADGWLVAAKPPEFEVCFYSEFSHTAW